MGSGRVAGILLSAALVAAGVGGCSGGSTTADYQPAASSTPSSSDNGGYAAPAPDPGLGAEHVVRAFYRALDGESFESAWSRLTPSEQAHMGGFDTWAKGFDNTVSTTVLSAAATDSSHSEASVAVELRSVDLDACGDEVKQRFSGSWHLTRSSGHWLADSIHMTKVAGREPVTDPDACGSGGGGGDSNSDGQPPDYSTPTPDPSLPDTTSPDPSDFCDTHDCIPNFDNGNGSIVQCEDGEWSHSGGISGACSYHGGVAPKVVGPRQAAE
jgi:hypothetical protein